MKKIFSNIFYFLHFDVIYGNLLHLILLAKVKRINKKISSTLKVVPQGGMDFELMGVLDNFSIDNTSHLKTGSNLECTGGIAIGKYFHCGRGLTIFSTEHNWKNGKCIPYDAKTIKRPVIIHDFVWCGANVTLLAGSTIGEGAILGAGSVVRGEIPPLAIVMGNPGIVVGYRDAEQFKNKKESGNFY